MMIRISFLEALALVFLGFVKQQGFPEASIRRIDTYRLFLNTLDSFFMVPNYNCRLYNNLLIIYGIN